MNIGITVIIAHYAPVKRSDFYFGLLKRTVASVRNQSYDGEVEIIVCDDGSHWSRELQIRNDVNIFYNPFNHDKLKELDIDLFLTLPDINLYRGIILKRKAFEIAKYNKIVVLDDDHPFIYMDSLKRFDFYLNKYKYVRGRIIGPRGLPKLYLTNNAQGTTYGLTKEAYFEIGGFGEYLDNNGYGEDNDLLIRMYLKFKNSNPKQACWAGEIVTKDLASNRWADRADIGFKTHELQCEREIIFIDLFKNIYGMHPFFNNPSRKKISWVKIGSLQTIISEIKFIFIFIIKYPYEFFYKLSKIKNFKHFFKILKNRISRILTYILLQTKL